MYISETPQRTEDALQNRFKLVDKRINQILDRLAPVPLTTQDQQTLKLTPQQTQQVQQNLQKERKLLTPSQVKKLEAELGKLDLQMTKMTKIKQQLDQINIKQIQAEDPFIDRLWSNLEQRPLTRQQEQPIQGQDQQQIPVTVRFESIKIPNDNDDDRLYKRIYNMFKSGSAKDGGDWILDAFVNGQNVHLSANRLLDEVYSGRTYRFPPSAQTTVSVPSNGLLAINVRGTDVDGCDKINWNALTPQNLYNLGLPSLSPKVRGLLNTQGLSGFTQITSTFDVLSSGLLGTKNAGSLIGGSIGSLLMKGAADTVGPADAAGGPVGIAATVLGPVVIENVKKSVMNLFKSLCGGPNDIIGDIDQLYRGPLFSTSPSTRTATQTVESDTGAYILTYNIVVGGSMTDVEIEKSKRR